LNKLDLITIRDYQPEQDKNFITATWLRGLYFGNEWFKFIEKDVYFKTYNLFLNMLLQKPGVTAKIACLKDSPDVILGYSVYTGNTLHWAHVKEAWRKIGVSKLLIPKEISHASHFTRVGKTLMLKNNIKFNPFNI